MVETAILMKTQDEDEKWTEKKGNMECKYDGSYKG